MKLILKNFTYSIVIATLLLLMACNGSERKNGIETFDVELYTPVYASGFKITGSEGKESVLLSVTNPWQGAQNVESQLLVLKGGESVPEGFSGQVLNGEACRIVAMSSTHVAMLDAIGAVDRIVAVSGIDFISNPYIQAHRDSIGDVGYEGNVNYESLVAANPDLVLLYGVTGASPIENKLKELGIPYMYLGDYVEESPLGKAEWVVAIAQLVGGYSRGEAILTGVVERYNDVKSLVQYSDTLSRPKVMLNIPYGDAWFMPSVDNYMVQLISDAGGCYMYTANNTGCSTPIDMEEAYKMVSEADVWLNTGTLTSLGQLKTACPKFIDTECFMTGNVYNNNQIATVAGGNDFYESAVMHPDIVLRDLIKIFYPNKVDEPLVYYRQLH